MRMRLRYPRPPPPRPPMIEGSLTLEGESPGTARTVERVLWSSRVVTGSALRRWAAVVAGTALVLSVPAIADAAGSLAARARSDAPSVAPREFVRRALASASVPHTGLAESRGTLGLPDVRQFGDVAALLGGTTRERVWWAGPDRWRVARLLASGEQDLYSYAPDTVVTWDYERNLQRTTTGVQGARLPRTDDLLPPRAARRLLASAAPGDPLTALPDRYLAGHLAPGVRITPASTETTIGVVDVWVDPASGLPLAVRVADRHGVVAFESAFLDVDVTAPAETDVEVPAPPGAGLETGQAPDLVALADRYARRGLPRTVAGQARVRGVLGGTATYGAGFARFVVVPLPPDPAGDVLDAVRLRTKIENVPAGQVAVVASGVVSAAIAVSSSGQGAFLVAGLVPPDLVKKAAKDLLTSPEAVTF